MSAARPVARSIFSLARLPTATASASATSKTSAAPASIPTCHHFHSSAPLAGRRRRFANVSAKAMGLVTEEKVQEFTNKKFPSYTADEMAKLTKRFSPEQIYALQAGEDAINPRDFATQGRFRTDPYNLEYIDDFADIQPIIDQRPRREAPPDPLAKLMNLDEFTEDLVKWAESFPSGQPSGTLKKLTDFVGEQWREKPEEHWPADVKDAAHQNYVHYLKMESAKVGPDGEGGVTQLTDTDVLRYILERSAWTDNNAKSNSFMAPALPNKVPGVEGLYRAAVDPLDNGMDPENVFQELKKKTGMSLSEIMDIKTKIIVSRRVSNMTRLGKIPSASRIAIAGNGNGWLGIGVVKQYDNEVANRQATLKAIENMLPVRRYEKRTIFGNIEGKVSGTVVKMSARPPGFGLRVSHRLFWMCSAAGIKDLAASIPRSRNPMNTVFAAYQALMNQPNPEEIARGRGRKLVDVRKVYYGGNVF